MKKLVNSDLDLSFVVVDGDDVVSSFISFVKANGLNAGKKPVAELLAGKRDEVAGFYLVVEDSLGDEIARTEAELEAEAAPVLEAPVVKAPTAGAADEKPAFPEDLVKAAIAAFAGPVVTAKPAAAASPAPVKGKVAKELKAVAPAGKIKPVRKGTKIANGLEALLGGVTAEALLAAGIGDDVVDFCNRRVTKRGYGIALLDGGVIKLVLPEGVTSVAFSG